MAALYSATVARAKTLPALWLISDARNDAVLESALARLPRGSGFVFRHYHLGAAERAARFATLAAAALAHGHCVILSGSAAEAESWGADGIYGPPKALGEPCGLLRLATAHDSHEIALANSARTDGIFLSPVFPTRSHPGADCLGEARFRALAAEAAAPVIALGGMTAQRASRLDWPRWAAIDGLS